MIMGHAPDHKREDKAVTSAVSSVTALAGRLTSVGPLSIVCLALAPAPAGLCIICGSESGGGGARGGARGPHQFRLTLTAGPPPSCVGADLGPTLYPLKIFPACVIFFFTAL